jgi:predicted ATPase
VEDEEEDKWHFDSTEQEEADKDKIDEFIRKIEALQAEAFIDPPVNLAEFGLEPAEAKVTIWVKEYEEKSKEITVLIGKMIKEKDEKDKEEEEEEEEEKAESETQELEETEVKSEEKEFVFVKNTRFDYLFKVDAEFLEQLPEKKEDWEKI